MTGGNAKLERQALGACGTGVLDFERQSGGTVVRTAFARSPLRLLTPKNRGRAAWVYTSSLGGGLVGGDQIDLSLNVREGAKAVLLSQSSTKIFRSLEESSQSIHARLEKDALLLCLPDPTVCFRGSRFAQTQDFELAESASLLLVDTFHGGRADSGERWLFDRFRNRIRVKRSGHLLFQESLLLDSRAGALPERMGRFNSFSLLFMIGPHFTEFGRAIANHVSRQPTAPRAELLETASALGADGTIVRLAGASMEEVGNAVRRHLHFVPEILGDNPWARKW